MAEKTKAQIAAENKKARDKRIKFTESKGWHDYVTKNFGWLVNIYDTVPEMAGIIRDYYVYDRPFEYTQNQIYNSKWYLGLQSGEYEYLKGVAQNDRAYLDKVDARVADVKTAAGTLGYQITDDQAKLLAAGALKGGWDSTRLTTEVGKQITTTATAGGSTAPTTPGATTTTSLQAGTGAATIRTVASSYGLKLTDDVVEGYTQAVLRGEITAEQIKSQFREQAKSLYPSLATQLDARTLNDATASYRSIAASTLGIDASAIDFSDATKFGKLLTYTDPKSGEARLMNATEWTQYLRSLPDWKNTKEAKNQYQGVIDSINNIFGKVR